MKKDGTLFIARLRKPRRIKLPHNFKIDRISGLPYRTPFAVHFEEADRGKTVYFAAAWQNDRGILGQWSEIKTAIAP